MQQVAFAVVARDSVEVAAACCYVEMPPFSVEIAAARCYVEMPPLLLRLWRRAAAQPSAHLTLVRLTLVRLKLVVESVLALRLVQFWESYVAVHAHAHRTVQRSRLLLFCAQLK